MNEARANRILAALKEHGVNQMLITDRTEKREELAAAGFYATGPDTEYKIYVARYLPDKDGSDAAGKDRFSQDHGLESALNRRTLLALWSPFPYLIHSA